MLTKRQMNLFIRRREEETSWRAFKQKWDKRMPRKNSAEFAEYCRDADRASEEMQKILDEIAAEDKE